MIQNKTNTYNEVIETSNEPMVFSDVQFLFNKYEEKVKECESLTKEVTSLKERNQALLDNYMHLAHYFAGFSNPSDFKDSLKLDLQNRLSRIYDMATYVLEDINEEEGE